jgi:RNA polymerase sigma-70 factor (family 1)
MAFQKMEYKIPTDEIELARLIKGGNQLAFATIFDRYNRQLYTLAFRYIKNREMAEDAVQHVFVNFWLNREKIDENRNIRSLLFTSIKNHTLNVLRNHKKDIERNYEILLEQEVDCDIFEVHDDHVQMSTLIEKAVETLSPHRRQIFYYKIMEGNSNQKIADKMGISVNTVKTQYYHILKEIREFIKQNKFPFTLLISYLF